jgi:hypothetical protein
MAVVRDDVTVGGLDHATLALNCGSGEANLDNGSSVTTRKLLAAVSGDATVTMPANFSAACAADASCSQNGVASVESVYVADADATLAVVQDWPAAALLAGLAADNTQLTAVSGE